MQRPPRPGPDSLPPTEPLPEVTERVPRASVGHTDTTVLDAGPPPTDGRPPRTPRWMLALMAAVVAIALYWWFAQTQQADQVAINATVTAANQATATADAASAAAVAAQATATAAQAQSQATAQAQATQAARQAADASATAEAQRAAEAASAEQARATAQAVSVDATVGTLATQQAAAARSVPTATSAVIVVTATPAPPAPTAPAPPPPPANPAPAPPPPPPPANQTTAPPAVAQPAPAGKPSAGGQPGPVGSPAAVASPAPVQPVPRGGASSATVAPNQATTLKCLSDRVQAQVAPGAMSARTILTCRQIEPGSIPAPPSPIVAETVFELTTSAGGNGVLPGKVNLTVTYPQDPVPPDQRGQLVLGYLDGDTWVPLPEQNAEPDKTRISAAVDRAGIYGLFPKP